MEGEQAPETPAAAPASDDSSFSWHKYSPDLAIAHDTQPTAGPASSSSSSSHNNSRDRSMTAPLPGSTPDSGGSSLSIRRLVFGASRGTSGDAEPRAAPSTSQRESSQAGGLPSLLKKLKQDAQDEILKATAHVREVVQIFRNEMALLECECDAVRRCHESNVDSLRAEVRALESQRAELLDEHSRVLAAKVELEQSQAGLEAECARLKEETRKANERADAMEAASVFLQTEEIDADHLRGIRGTGAPLTARLSQHTSPGAPSLNQTRAPHACHSIRNCSV